MAIVQHLTIDQNSTFDAEVTILTEDKFYFDLTNYTAYASMRKSPTSTYSVDFTCDIPTPTYGNVVLSLSDEETKVIPPGRYMYDVIIENSEGEKYRAIEGIITVNAGITVGSIAP